ncbi:hypothetical protein ACVWXO_002120 [Bradyrhizobium sp. LM2.7]
MAENDAESGCPLRNRLMHRNRLSRPDMRLDLRWAWSGPRNMTFKRRSEGSAELCVQFLIDKETFS